MKYFLFQRLLKPLNMVPTPTWFCVSINNVCNLRCRMCSIGRRVKDDFSNKLMTENVLDTQKWLMFFYKYRQFNLSRKPTVVIAGTEPFLTWERLKSIAVYCRETLRMNVIVTTNGTLLTKHIDELSLFDRINISIDGIGETHDRIRGVKGTFQKVMQSVETIFEESERPLIYVNYTVSDFNYNELVKARKTIPCDYMTFSHLTFITEEVAEKHNRLFPQLKVTPQCTNIDTKAIKPQVLWNQIKQVSKTPNTTFNPILTSMREVKRYYHEPLKFLPGREHCKLHSYTCAILPDGDLVLSTRCFNQARFGNIKHYPLSQIFNSRKLKKFRHLTATERIPACSRCCGVMPMTT